MWEDAPRGARRPQDAINDELRSCDYFLLLLHTRFGTYPGPDVNGATYKSGCEEEFVLAQRLHSSKRSPMRDLLVLFRSLSPDQLADPGPQLAKVLEFRERLERTHSCFYGTFSTLSDLSQRICHQLRRWGEDSQGLRRKPPNRLRALAAASGGIDVVVEQDEGALAAPQSDLCQQAASMIREGRLVAAERLFSSALVAGDDLNAVVEFARFYWSGARLTEAREILDYAFSIAVDHDDKHALCKIKSIMGHIHKDQGDFLAAEGCYTQALAIAKAISWKGGTADRYSNLGVLYKDQGCLERAITMHRLSLAASRELRDEKRIACDLTNLGIVYQKKHEYRRARVLHNRALQIEERLGDIIGAACDLGHLGAIALAENRISEAEQCLSSSLRAYEHAGNERGRSIQLSLLGEVARQKGHLAKAKRYHVLSLAIERQMSSAPGLKRQYEYLACVCEGLGDDSASRSYRAAARDLALRS